MGRRQHDSRKNFCLMVIVLAHDWLSSMQAATSACKRNTGNPNKIREMRETSQTILDAAQSRRKNMVGSRTVQQKTKNGTASPHPQKGPCNLQFYSSTKVSKHAAFSMDPRRYTRTRHPPEEVQRGRLVRLIFVWQTLSPISIGLSYSNLSFENSAIAASSGSPNLSSSSVRVLFADLQSLRLRGSCPELRR
jgi:hypothetical protein